MSFRPFSYFAFWARRKYSREDFIFWGIIAMAVLAAALFIWEGFILYGEFYQERIPVVNLSEPVISVSELDEVLGRIDKQKNEFDDVLESK